MTPPACSMNHQRIEGGFDSQEAKKDVVKVHTGEILFWRKVNAYVVVDDGLCVAHRGDTATGIRRVDC
jgi:L-ascorbate metabolism protein UlaG (beta-lactamase superfamily)